MEPGFYVVRMPGRGAGSRLMIESRPFNPHVAGGRYRDWIYQQAENWRDSIQSQHPRDDVFVIERKQADSV